MSLFAASSPVTYAKVTAFIAILCILAGTCNISLVEITIHSPWFLNLGRVLLQSVLLRVSFMIAGSGGSGGVRARSAGKSFDCV